MRRTAVTGGLSLVLALGGAVALGSGPSLELMVSFNEGKVYSWHPPGEDLGGGLYAYDGQWVHPLTGHVLFYSVTGDSNAALEANVSLFNSMNETTEVSMDLIFDTGQNGPDEPLLKGFGVVGITAGQDGGMITSSPPWLIQTLIDGEPIGIFTGLFYHPFEMSISGPGQAAAFSDFGITEPATGPPITESVGMRIMFTISGLDAAAVTGEIAVVNCPADLSDDGTVSTIDLTILLGAWGPCADVCLADLNGDGQVSTEDLLDLLGAWGSCPGL